ncbi:UAA transporter [Pyrenochaeta sp. MPI-SDFR-AT-0127]|nr:UAA transporter [Pyrenochaeta sp. MPI-SDFR-AT-0127]
MEKYTSIQETLAYIVSPTGLELSAILFLIFGGCCTNVFTLESIISNNSARPALALTFIQFIFVAVEGFAHHFRAHSKTLLKRPEVAHIQWFGIALLHFSISVMNNLSLEYHISVPVHIVLRSGGGLVTLVVGTIAGKTYTRMQWMSVLTMTGGVVMTAMSGAKTPLGDSGSGFFSPGVALLLVLQILIAVMGIMLENIYKSSPGIWREGLFYTHFLALPLFIPLMPKILAQISTLTSGTQVEMAMPRYSDSALDFPVDFILLTLNALTQFLCVKGVNLLTSVSSALSVCIVLNVRKLVSLLLSVWIFGTKLETGFILGTVVVFGSVVVYALDDWKRAQAQSTR